MKVQLTKLVLAGFASTLMMMSCGGGSGGDSQSNSPVPPIKDGGGGGLDPADPLGTGAPPPPKTIKQDEFKLTLVADQVIRSQVAIPVHIISTDADTANQLAGEGKGPAYWGDPWSGAHVVKRTFGSQGSGQETIQVPSIPAKDMIVLAADLAAPSAGNDYRIIKIPLELDYSDPLAPLARPIQVRLTRNGWMRDY